MNNNIRKRWLAGCFMAGLLLIMPGCDLLNQDPQDRLTREEFFQTEADATGTVIAIYDAVQAAEFRMAELGEARGDLIEAAVGNEYRNQYITPTGANARWSHFYNIINRSNTAIKYIPPIVQKDARFTQEMSNSLIAEAHFLRALAYFYMVRAWGGVPLITVPSDTDNQEYDVPATSQEEILNQIESDIQAALQLKIPVSYPSLEATKGRATQGAVYALLTDVSLWRNKYQQALDAANKIIENNNMYKLVGATDQQGVLTASKAQYMSIFFEGNSSESIFEVQHSFVQDEPNDRVTTYATGYNINTPGLQEKYSEENDNVRGALYASWGPVGELWKFVGGSTTSNTRRVRNDVNWIIYRLSDVILMRAEAYNRLGEKQKAIDEVQKIRNRAGLNKLPISVNSTNTVDEIEAAILYERGLELAFEGKRWFDLLRIAKRSPEGKTLMKTLLVASYPENDRSAAEGRILDERGWYMPIAASELQANKALVQNPYYR